MDNEYFLDKFKKAADSIDKSILDQKGLEISIGIVLNSIYLKLYKPEWTNDINNPLDAESRIFFSIWVNEKTILEKKVFYNIHAFKLRKLKGYSILSREFAESFRKQFLKYQSNWENISVEFGPLTLMQGWIELKEENFENDISNLTSNFIKIEYLIDNTLQTFQLESKM
jgi:hypothetical protein